MRDDAAERKCVCAGTHLALFPLRNRRRGNDKLRMHRLERSRDQSKIETTQDMIKH